MLLWVEEKPETEGSEVRLPWPREVLNLLSLSLAAVALGEAEVLVPGALSSPKSQQFCICDHSVWKSGIYAGNLITISGDKRIEK